MQRSRNRTAALLLGVVVVVTGSLVVASPASAAPPNDDYADAQAIGGAEGGVEGGVEGTTIGATTAPGETYSQSVWFAWTAPRDGVFTFQTEQSALSMRIGRRDGAAGRGDLCQHQSEVYSCIYKQVEAGATYMIEVGQYDGQRPAAFRLTWTPVPPPANDDLADATVLTGRSTAFPSPHPASGLLATLEPGEEPSYVGSTPARHSIWYEWTAPFASSVEIDVAVGPSPQRYCEERLSVIEVYVGEADDGGFRETDQQFDDCDGLDVEIDTAFPGQTFLIKLDSPDGPTPVSGTLVATPRCGVTGTDGDDVLEPPSSSGRYVVCGGRGDDVLRGGGDDDLLIGGRGDDVLRGGAGADRLQGGQGRDRCVGGAGTDRFAGCEVIRSVP
ncbi:calcium-binding protein [Nocardioides sp. AX2bis]|uniref:calcium-binding protein n=1 Tax=Nocardioides sp. AX2bis TaxID=2653157 RepID=UPI00191663C3|nr:calcium-binding protein [Nocardioides sp. AX2bis]